MKLVKTKVYLGLFLFAVSLLISFIPLSSTPVANADPATAKFVDAKGATIPSLSESQFTFLSPWQIQFKNPNGTTDNYYVNMQQCQGDEGSDAMYLCGPDADPNGDTFATQTERGLNYWYWPHADGTGDAIVKSINGQTVCPSALVVGIGLDTGRNNGQEVLGASLSAVTPDANPDGSCVLYDGQNGGKDRAIVKASTEGTGVAVVKTDHTHSEDSGQGNCDDGADADICNVARRQVVSVGGGQDDLIKHNNSSQDRKTLLGLGTIFVWKDKNTIQSYFNTGYTLTKITAQTSPAVFKDLTASFKGASGSITGFSKYDFYTNVSTSNGCYNKDNQSYQAMLVVSPTDPSQAQVLRRSSENRKGPWTDTWTTGNENANWEVFRCLYGSSDQARSTPSLVWMDPDHQHYNDKIGLANWQLLKDPNAVVGSGSGAGDGNSSDLGSGPQIHCDVTFNPLTWFLCPIANMLVGLAQDFDGLIASYLCIPVDTSTPEGFSSCDSTPTGGGNSTSGDTIAAYRTAWAAMRDISLGFVVIIGLLAIVSQSSGLQIFDAYTIKKTMPRLLLAAIGVSLSWPILNWFIQLTNDLGFGVRNLIYQPFVNNANTGFNIQGGFIGTFFGGGGFATLLGIGGLVSFAATAALFGAVVFLVLTLRQVAVIALVIAAPIAMMLYAAPFGQKIAGRWWSEFMGLTMVFPFVSGAIAIGHVFGLLAMANSGSGIRQIAGFAMYFAGEVMALGIIAGRSKLMGGITNAVRKPAQKGFEYLNKRRGALMSKNLSAARAGKRWNEGFGEFGKADEFGRRKSLGRIVNRAALYGTDADEMIPGRLGKWRVPGFKGYAAKAGDAINHKTMEHVGKAYQHVRGMHYEAFRGLSGNYEKWLTRDANGNLDAEGAGMEARLKKEGLIDKNGRHIQAKTLSQFEGLSRAMHGSGNEKIRTAAGQLEANAGFLHSINTDPELYRASHNLGMIGAMGLAAAGRLEDYEATGMLNRMRSDPRQGAELAAQASKQLADISTQNRPEQRDGWGWHTDSDGKYFSVFDENAKDKHGNLLFNQETAKGNVLSLKPQQIAGAKGEFFDTTANTWKAILKPGQGDDYELARGTLFQAAGIYGTDNEAKRKIFNILDDDTIGPMANDGTGRTQLRADYDEFIRTQSYDQRQGGLQQQLQNQQQQQQQQQQNNQQQGQNGP